MVVAAPGHPLASAPGRPVGDLAGYRWLTGPAGLEPGSEEERWADAGGAAQAQEVDRCDSEAAALAAVRTGAGVMLALTHSVGADLARGTLVRPPVEGTR